MDFEFIYRPARLEEQLAHIRKRYPSHEEFTRLDHSGEITGLLKSFASVHDDMVEQYAGTLKNSEIELALLALPDCSDRWLCGKIENILVLRFRKKLFELNWIMLQSDYENSRLLKSMSILAECLREKNPAEYANTIFPVLAGWEDGFPEKVHDFLLSEGLDIKQFFRKYDINEEREFGKRVSELFFLGCSGEDFSRNRTVFTGLLEHMDTERAAVLFSCYLGRLKAQEYFDDLSRFIIERFGAPDDGAFWGRIPEECKERFCRWQELKSMEMHFGRSSKRFRLWAEYFESMKRITRDEAEGLLLMDFGDFVAVDYPGDADASYIYNLKYFESELERRELAKTAQLGAGVEAGMESGIQAGMESGIQAGDGWRIIPEHVVDARDFIIEGITSEVYRVGYDRVQLLYLKEVLKEKLGLNSRQ